MTRQEYTKLANGLYSKYKNDCYDLALEYVMSTLDCKKGDIAEDNDGTKIIVESIVITDSLSGIPSYYLTGSLLKKDLTKRVDGSKFTIQPHYLKQIHKS